MPEGPFQFRPASRRRGQDEFNLLEDIGLPSCLPGEEPEDLEIGSLWWNAATNRPRFRTPTGDLDVGVGNETVGPHAVSHQNGGFDEINVTGLSGLLADPQEPASHAFTHELNGIDELNVTGLQGVLAEPQTANVLIVNSETELTIGVVPDGHVLVRSGSTVIGALPSGALEAAYRGTGGGSTLAASFTVVPGLNSMLLPVGYSRVIIRGLFNPSGGASGLATVGFRPVATGGAVVGASRPSYAHLELSRTGSNASAGAGSEAWFTTPLSFTMTVNTGHHFVIHADVFLDVAGTFQFEMNATGATNVALEAGVGVSILPG